MCVHKAADGVCLRFTDESAISYCVEGPCPHDALSNADRIRSMSDEELAKHLFNFQVDAVCGWLTAGGQGCKTVPEMLDWLREPMEEVDR